ncbi:MAG: AsnC family protein [Oscillospiraceae bacterium]|nr:AsnC family protein [Oscillospiraceae bacterium]
MGKGRNWTTEEEEYLRENWGHVTVDGLCRHLDRSKNAIMCRVHRLGLPPYLESGDYVTLNQLYRAFRGRNAMTYLLKSWVEERGMPVHKKRRGSGSYRIIYLDEFWKWAEKNRSFLDFSKMEPLALGMEPPWVEEQRHKDFDGCANQRKDPWTSLEDQQLLHLLRQHRYGYAELAEILHRSAGAIQRRCNDLQIKERPVKAENTGREVRWTEENLRRLADGIRRGDSYALIGKAVGKSEKAVRGKVFTVYLTENADKVREMIGAGEWGNNAPIPTVAQGRHLPKWGTQIRGELTRLDAVLRYRMNELGYDQYWQRHMCLHWDDYDGCTAGEKNCDECISFQRIPPQYCVRCGATFYERAKNTYCGRCRDARKKKAQRHWAIARKLGKEW